MTLNKGFHYYHLFHDCHYIESHRTAQGTVSSSNNAHNASNQNQPTLKEVRDNQSLTTTVVQIVPLSKSTLSPDEDLQYAVQALQSICN